MPTLQGLEKEAEQARADSLTRFGGPRANPRNETGRPRQGWIRKILAEKSPEGAERREQILRHLIEIATEWEVRVLGKGSDGELLKVASGRDAVEAAKLLFLYDIGRPVGEMELAEHMRKVARDGADLAIKVLGTRLYSMAPKELAEFFRECGGNSAGFWEAAKALAEEPGQPPTVEAQVEGEGQSVCLPSEPASEPAAPVLPDSDEGWPKP